MYYRFQTLAIFLVLFSAIYTSNCSDAPLSEASSVPSVAGTLKVTPSDSVSIGFLDEIIFEVSLKDMSGTPIVGAPIIASFIGDAGNATLAPSSFHTSEQGSGQIIFTAPTKPVSFEIRFKSPENEISVEVVVDPTLSAVSFDVDYPGKRDLALVEAALYRDVDCADITTSAVTPERTFERDAVFPVTFDIDGLAENGSYTVQVTGKNERDQPRASLCLPNVSPSHQYELLRIEDIPLDIAGQFITTTHLKMPDVMSLLVEQLGERIQFIVSPETAILDEIETTLSEDQFAQEAFNQYREEHTLEVALETYFSEAQIDVGDTFAPVWAHMDAAMSSFNIIGALEIESSQEASLLVYHELEWMVFMPNTADPLEYYIRNPDTADGTARRGADDTLFLDEHTISLGLGLPLSFLFRTALSDTMAVQELDQALMAVVDCEAVAIFLEPLLADITTFSVIEQSCRESATTATEQLNAAITELNLYDQLTLSALCDIQVPLEGVVIDRMVSRTFDVEWDDFQMKAESFEANRIPQP